VPVNPAAAVRGPKHVVKTGKTAVLDAKDHPAPPQIHARRACQEQHRIRPAHGGQHGAIRREIIQAAEHPRSSMVSLEVSST